jgi:hypothetical protein
LKALASLKVELEGKNDLEGVEYEPQVVSLRNEILIRQDLIDALKIIEHEFLLQQIQQQKNSGEPSEVSEKLAVKTYKTLREIGYEF